VFGGDAGTEGVGKLGVVVHWDELRRSGGVGSSVVQEEMGYDTGDSFVKEWTA
jgi:hypothetical protein